LPVATEVAAGEHDSFSIVLVPLRPKLAEVCLTDYNAVLSERIPEKWLLGKASCVARVDGENAVAEDYR
jgi:hypothetical protein